MTTTQKVLITTAFAAAVGTGVYEWAQNSRLRNDLQRMEGKLKPLAEQNEQLLREQDELEKKFLSAQQDAEQWKRQIAELPKLRGDVARLRESERELAQLKAGENADPAQAEMKSWLARVDQLKKRLEANADQKIPELQFLTEKDWLDAARNGLETEKDFRKALSLLRHSGEGKFVSQLNPALVKYMEANGGKFPTEMVQLQPYFKSPMDENILQRYEIIPAKNAKNMNMGGDWVITQRAAVDKEFDSRATVGVNGWGSSGGAWKSEVRTEEEKAYNTLSPALKAYEKAFGVSQPSDFSRLKPFLSNSEQSAALEILLEVHAKREAEKK